MAFIGSLVRNLHISLTHVVDPTWIYLTFLTEIGREKENQLFMTEKVRDRKRMAKPGGFH